MINGYSAALACAAEPTECKATHSAGVITQEGYECYVYFFGITRVITRKARLSDQMMPALAAAITAEILLQTLSLMIRFCTW